ncbi:MAG: hypothetical protein IE884_01585, partial [Sulfuricurvum sp.]|nr:hypothetical protein [Sulfuricurvum sp.]
MKEMKPLSIQSYLSYSEIEKLLDGVEYIMMASPSLVKDAHPIHFTIILNTSDPIPEEIKPLILEKFCREHA